MAHFRPWQRERFSLGRICPHSWTVRVMMTTRLAKFCGLACVTILLVLGLVQATSSTLEATTPRSAEAVDPSSKVKVAVYYETLCGDSRRFLTGEILKTYLEVGNIMDLELIPYGKARERQSTNGTWVFTCHFGTNECKANLIQTCAIKLYWKLQQVDVMNFIRCMERQRTPHVVARQCAENADLDYRSIRHCRDSNQGNVWQHEMAAKTQALNPPLNFVPWVTVNGVHDESYHDDYLENLTKIICEVYKGKPVEACSNDK